MVDIFRKVDTMSRPMADTPKRRPRRQFDDDFKAQAVRLVLDEGKSIPSVARDLDLTESSLRCSHKKGITIPFPSLAVLSDYSDRRAIIGSIRMDLRAGT